MKINLFEIAFLTRKQVNRFHSDFRVVADYFVQKRESGDYQPSRETLRHVEATLQLLSVMTNDRTFEEVYDVNLPGGGVRNMCDVLEKVEKRGINKGIDIGREEERINNIQNIMQALKLTAQQAMDVLKIPAAEQPKYAAKL